MTADIPKNQIRSLSRVQRRVIGVLMEKGYTTPDQYPLTLKAATTGCNQKSNRDPVTNYSEDQVMAALDELRESGLVAEVYTDGGRAARYRHYMRHNFDFSEAQFAIIAELLLRGKQQPGELRTRASRMVRIENLEDLKTELNGLQEKGYLQSSGDLSRRGVEVDHMLYTDSEHSTLETLADEPAPARPAAAPQAASSPPTAVSSPPVTSVDRADTGELRELRDRLQEQSELIRDLETRLESVTERIDRLERDLGV